MKVYFLYKKDDDKNWLYAYTTSKHLKNRFLLERDHNKFISKKMKMSKDEYDDFQKINYELELILSPLPSTKEFNISVVMTQLEEKDLLGESYIIEDEMDMLCVNLLYDNLLTEKEKESIKYLTTTSTIDDKLNHISTCNMMRLFVNLYSDTFKTEGGQKIWQK